jgi:general stress protein CsbA
MSNSRKIQLIFGLIIAVIYFLGLFMIASENQYGTYFLYAGLGAGLVYWIWSIIIVISASDLKKYQRTFWLIIVVAVPFFGALLYNILHQSRNKIAA